MAYAPKFTNTVGTYDFSAEFVDQPEFDDATDIASEKVPRRHGVYVGEEPTRSGKPFTFNGIIVKSTADAAHTQLNSLLSILNGPVGKFYMNNTTGRYINCYKESVPWRYMPGSGMQVISYTVTFFAHDPYWYDQTQTTSTHTNIASAATVTETNAGSEYVFPVVTVTPAGAFSLTSVQLENLTSSKTWTYSGTIASGQSLVVDTANFTAANNGTSDMANFANTFWSLKSGANSVRYTGSGGNATFTFTYRPRYSAPVLT